MNFGSNSLVVIFLMLAGPHPRSRRLDSLRSLAAAAGAFLLVSLILDLRPGRSLPRTVEDRLHDAVRAVPVLEGRKGGRVRIARLPAFRDEPVNIAHQVRKRIGPRFLMASGQVRVPPGFRVEQRGIL